MSKLTNFAENALVDFIRGQTLTLPASWYIALGTAADDGSFTEVTGTNYGRIAVARSLANFSGTQGVGSVVASTGTSHETRNNTALTTPVAGAGGWTAATKLGIFDAAAAGNCWFYGDLGSTVTVSSGNSHTFAIGTLSWVLGLTGGMTDYLANKLIDLIWRAQAFSWPGTTYIRLVSTTPTNAAGGIEFTGGNYARVGLISSLAELSGTQGAGTTVASSGTGGRTSNNTARTFPTPSASWGTAVAVETLDSATLGAGNRLWWAMLGSPKTIGAGAAAPRFDPNTLGFTFA